MIFILKPLQYHLESSDDTLLLSLQVLYQHSSFSATNILEYILQLRYLEEHEFEKIGKLDHDDLIDLKSLVGVVKKDEGPVLPGANDAGIESSYAIQYGRDGNAVPVLLGMSGDDVYEKPDPSAQGLYLAARRLFPYVTCYDGSIGARWLHPCQPFILLSSRRPQQSKRKGLLHGL